MYRIGHHVIDKRTILAPMAGVTDLPFRQLCRRYGAGLTVSEMVTAETLLSHLEALHRFYGERRGVRMARKHVGWYLDTLPGGTDLRRTFNRLDGPSCQYRTLRDYFHNTTENREQAA